ncbi:hypothetical protein PINS_up002379 [Pythium insidiosum]|nr:hypothetical protein PINS_up002379 [Pythium insidiosum]
MEGAPCLSCGQAAPLAGRVDCSLSGFPLTCSKACAHSLLQSHRGRVEPFREVTEDLVFAQTPAARTLMTEIIPSARREQPTTRPRDWEAFLRLFTNDDRWLRDESAVRLVSAAYTFVMTLSAFLDALAPLTTPEAAPVRLHVIGARAEATMPRHIWQELLVQQPDHRFEIKLVGDHVPPMRHQQQSRLHLENCPGLYHEVKIEQPADAFVLFNPGIGHPRLHRLWRPTLEVLVASGKPVLLTSFSQRDLERDLAALPPVEFLVEPRLNPFGSRMYQLDPSDVFAPIQTNRHVMVIKG